MPYVALLVVFVVARLTVSAAAAPAPDTSICLMLDAAAQANGLPVDFLTRVIWRESRFDPGAVGPTTRSGARAEGIAQFMPGTAAERALDDPFDPVQALPKAAAFLRDLRDEFGNLGLAAAAYNAGPQRVRDWLAGTRSMPAQTRSYVRAITGHGVDEWARASEVGASNPLNCAETLASLDAPPSIFAYQLEQRVTTAVGKPWGVELVAGFARERVLSFYARAMQRLSQIIGAHDPVITRVMSRSRGTSAFYQARIGVDTRPAADDLCARIRRAGGACMVIRNMPGRFHIENMEVEKTDLR